MSTGIETIPNQSNVHLVWIEPKFSAICSVGLRPFWGTIKIEFRPDNLLLEFVSVEKYIHSFANEKVTIEDLTRLVFDECARVLGDISLKVTAVAETTVHAPAGAIVQRGDW